MGVLDKFVESVVSVVTVGTVDLDISEGRLDIGSPDIGEAVGGISGGLVEDVTGLSGEEQLGIGAAIVLGAASLPLLGIVTTIGGALLAADAQKDQAKRTQQATEEFALIQQDLTIESIESRSRRNLERISFDQRQDLILQKLQNVQIRRKASIAGARQRSAAQRSRIGGVGGSLAGVRTGASELRTEVETQLFNLQVERDARTEARQLDRQSINEEANLGTTQARVTAGGAIAGARAGATAAATRADIQTTQSVIQGTPALLTNPAVSQQINDFFNQPDTPVINTNPTGDILVNPTVPRTA